MGEHFNLKAYTPLSEDCCIFDYMFEFEGVYFSQFPKVHISIAIDFGKSTLYTMHVYMSWQTEAKVTLVHFPQVPSRNAHWRYCADDLVEVF